MPRKGRKTIDLPEVLVDRWKSIFEKNKEELNLIGITSLQGLISKILHGLLEEGEVPKDLVKFLLD